MKVVIKESALKDYMKQYKGASIPNKRWVDILRDISGKTLEVDTSFLFNDQYNIVEPNIRVMDDIVERIIDDARIGRMRCQWCGKNSEVSDVCPHCEKSEYLEKFKVWEKPIIKEYAPQNEFIQHVINDLMTYEEYGQMVDMQYQPYRYLVTIGNGVEEYDFDWYRGQALGFDNEEHMMSYMLHSAIKDARSYIDCGDDRNEWCMMFGYEDDYHLTKVIEGCRETYLGLVRIFDWDDEMFGQLDELLDS